MKKKFSRSDMILFFIFLFIVTFMLVLFLLNKYNEKELNTVNCRETFMYY